MASRPFLVIPRYAPSAVRTSSPGERSPRRTSLQKTPAAIAPSCGARQSINSSLVGIYEKRSPRRIRRITEFCASLPGPGHVLNFSINIADTEHRCRNLVRELA